MPLRRTFLALVAFVTATPAAADLTLRYVPEEGSRMGLVIEADDQGRIRAEGSNGQLLIVRDGQTYVIPPHDGEPLVVRLEDFIALGEEQARAFRESGVVAPAREVVRYQLHDRGPERVGPWPGRRLTIERVGPHDPDLDSFWVVSEDPALADAGRLAVTVFDTQTRIAEVLFGPDPAEFQAFVRQIFGRGALLRVNGVYRLESLSREPVPASRFDLPGPVLSRDQARERLPR